MSTSAVVAPPFFQLRSASTAGSPRLGCVLDRLPTPHVLTYTQHGLPPHLTVDNWRHLPDMTAFHVPLASLVSQPSASALASSHCPPPASLASYLRYPPSSFLLLSLSDPALATQQCSDTSVLLATPQGNQRVSPLQLVQRARALRPDALLLASDGHTAASEAERGREKKAVWRSVRWLKEQMAALYSDGGDSGTAQPQGSEAKERAEDGERKTKKQRRSEQQDAVRVARERTDAATGDGFVPNETSAVDTAPAHISAARHVKPPHVIVSVPLTADAALQQHSVAAVLAHSHLVDGYSVAISPANADTELSTLLPAVLSQLPASSLRLCSSHPPTLSSLFAVACSGVDLISSAVPYHHSLRGLALSLHEPALSLHSSSLATSPLPLALGCSCYTCTHHTRAYLHHLLAVKEMTAAVLLDMHNTHTVLQLMRTVRERLAAHEGMEGWQEWKDQWRTKLETNERVEREQRERERQKVVVDLLTPNLAAFVAADEASRAAVPASGT